MPTIRQANQDEILDALRLIVDARKQQDTETLQVFQTNLLESLKLGEV